MFHRVKADANKFQMGEFASHTVIVGLWGAILPFHPCLGRRACFRSVWKSAMPTVSYSSQAIFMGIQTACEMSKITRLLEIRPIRNNSKLWMTLNLENPLFYLGYSPLTPGNFLMREFVHFRRKKNLLWLGFQIVVTEDSTDKAQFQHRIWLSQTWYPLTGKIDTWGPLSYSSCEGCRGRSPGALAGGIRRVTSWELLVRKQPSRKLSSLLGMGGRGEGWVRAQEHWGVIDTFI